MNVNEFYQKLIEKLNKQKQPMILDEFQHIKAPAHILQQVKSIVSTSSQATFQAYGNDQAFVIDSVQYKTYTHDRCAMPYLHQHFPTFRQMDEAQKNWYFYWRSCAIKGEYLPTHLSYLNIFFYELINYSYSEDASFNISMLKKLYDAYHTVFEIEHVKDWVADMLIEANEIKLAMHFEQKETSSSPLYMALKEQDDLARIAMSMWRPYIHEGFVGNSAFYRQFQQDVEQTFQLCLPHLEQLHVEEDGKRLVELYFEEKTKTIEKPLFQYALTFRAENIRQIDERKIVATERLYKEIHAYITLCENVTRALKNEREQLPYDKSVLPTNLRSIMMQKMFSLQTTDRFKVVKVPESQQAATPLIPRRPDVSTVVPEEHSVLEEETTIAPQQIEEIVDEQEKIEEQLMPKPVSSLLFDEEALRKLEEQDEQFVQIYNDYDEEEEIEIVTAQIEPNFNDFLNTASVDITDETVQQFMNDLERVERDFLQLFDHNLQCEKTVANQFAVSNNVLLRILVSSINEKAQDIFGENVIEELHSNLQFVEDFEMILTEMEGK